MRLRCPMPCVPWPPPPPRPKRKRPTGGLITDFQAAECVIPPLLQLLCGGSTLVRRWAIELLIQLTGGWAHSTEDDLGNAGLSERCRQRAREGLSVVYWLATGPDWETRDAAVELLDYLEPDTPRLLWIVQHISESDPHERVRDMAQRVLAKRTAPPASA